MKCDGVCAGERHKGVGGGPHSKSPLDEEGQASPNPSMHPLGRLGPPESQSQLLYSEIITQLQKGPKVSRGIPQQVEGA